jgi:SAM-dependent methyltransferase
LTDTQPRLARRARGAVLDGQAAGADCPAGHGEEVVMLPSILDFARRTKHKFGVVPGVVLEVGSYNVNGTIRDVYQPDALSYTGVDLSPGPCVDVVCDSHHLGDRFAPESFDTVLCCETLEHDLRPWVTVAHLHALLKPGGHLLITTPTFGFPLHRYPIDCYRFGEDAYRHFLFEGMDVLRLEEVHDEHGYPVICCLGRKPRPTGPNASGGSPVAHFSIPKEPTVGVVIGTHGTPGYVALHLHVLQTHNPEVPVLVVDDCSPQYQKLLSWCKKYKAELFVNPVRLGHAKGDMGVFAQGLLWAKRRELDLLVKFSRRFLPVCTWVRQFTQLAVDTQHHTYSNECNNSGFGFQTQAVGMHVDSHYSMLPEYLRGTESDQGLTEAFVHQRIAQRIPLPPAAVAHENRHKGFATWRLLGNRQERSQLAFWHETHPKADYQALASALGIAAGIEEF